MNEEQELLELYKNKDIDKLFDKVGEYYHKWLNNTKKLDFYKQEIERLNKRIEDLNIINEEHKTLNGMIRKELQQKENIIKEVREKIRYWQQDYIETFISTDELDEILEILDKGEK